MSSKLIIIPVFVIALLALGGYFVLADKKQTAVEKEVRDWQAQTTEYLTFDYKHVSSRLWDNTITLEQVQVTYPVLLSLNEVQIKPTMENAVLEELYLHAKGVNFTLPGMTENQPWQGNLTIDYAYDPALQQVDLFFALEFPGLLVGNIATQFINVTPGMDIIFNYTDVLLQQLSVELENEGLIKSATVMGWANSLNNHQQRDAFINFLQNQQTLYINFVPEYAISVQRLMENPMIFWQHPAVEVHS